jgi:predicted DNA-binding protein (UPF0251 family)
MPRPRKWRKVSHIPENKLYLPVDIKDRPILEVHIKMEELEAIRLKDVIGLNQQACADKMEVSRQTFQNILDLARKKVAKALTESMGIRITGGDYTFNICKYSCQNCGKMFSSPYEIDKIECPICESQNVICIVADSFCQKGCRKECNKEQSCLEKT